ncbi:RDD family protein [Phycisphaerales bacterium AB-hyl4]|uniref:RDD family protein n=1 Tax=Natronomicrosphaera hydrolytica TaxID=3242702 RepID=A0ABV4U8F5_9BACT
MRQYQITTPEQVQFRYEVAGLMSRAMAWVVDQLILWAARLGFVFALSSAGQLSLAAVFVSIFVLDFGYYAWFELRQAGQSPGKRLLGLRVIPASGAQLSFADVMIRNLLRSIDTLPMMMVLGGTVAWIDRYHRRLGDLAAETLVVRDVRTELPAGLLAAASRDNSFMQDARLRQRVLGRVSREERDLLFDLMMRRDQLDRGRREALFAEAATYFRHRYNLPEGLDHLSDEQTVLNLALLLQAGATTLNQPNTQKATLPGHKTLDAAG